MPGRRTRVFEIATLRFNFGRVAFAPPLVYWLVLCTTAPTDTVTGTAVVDSPLRLGKRKSIPNSPGSWTVPDPLVRGETRNVWQITWQTSKQNVTGIGWGELWDARTGGQRRYWGTFINATGAAVKFDVPVGTRLRILAQGIVSRED